MSEQTLEKRPETTVANAERMRPGRTFVPNVDIIEQRDALIMQADMPGVAPDALARRRQLMGQVNRLQIEAAGASRRERVARLVGSEAFRTTVQAIRLSPEVAIVGLPGEIVAEVGLALKASSGLPACLVFGYTGDSIGYVVVPPLPQVN